MFALQCASIISRKIFGIPRFRPTPIARAPCRGVALVAENPTDHHVLKAFTGVSDLDSSSIGITARTENGQVEIGARIVCDRFGISPEVNGEGMTLNALRFEVADIAQG